MAESERKSRRTTTPSDVAFTVRISTETDRILGQLADTQCLAKASFVRELIEREPSRARISGHREGETPRRARDARVVGVSESQRTRR